MLLILERVGLGQHAAATVPEQRDFAQAESNAHGFNVLHVALNGVLARVLQALGAAGAALIDKDEAMGARQGQQPGQEVGVVGAGTAMQHHQRRAFAEFHVVDEHAVGVDKAILHRVDGRGSVVGSGLCSELGSTNDQDTEGEASGSDAFHGHHATAESRDFLRDFAAAGFRARRGRAAAACNALS